MTLPPITNKQKEILLLLYRFRFLTRPQIQKLLHNKHPKNINIWLKDLTEKDYTRRIYEKTREEINNPARYYLGRNGIKFLREQNTCEKAYLQKFYQENRRSDTFILRCLLIVDIYLNLFEKKLSGFKFYTPSDFPKNGVIRKLLPSFAYVKEDKNEIKHYAGEILKEGMPRFAIRARIKQYMEFFAEDEGSYIIFICPTDDLRIYVSRFTQKYLQEESIDNIDIHITTKEMLF